MKRNGGKSLILGLVSIIGVVLFYVEQAFSGEEQPEKKGVYTVSEFKNEFGFQKDSLYQDSAFLQQKGGDAYLKVRAFDGISLEHAVSYFADKVFSVRSHYRDAHSPYPGALSNKIDCPNEFKPQRIKHALMDYYLLYANQRFTYGACLWDLIEYRSVLYPLYCSGTKRFHQIELFVPKNNDISDYQEALERLSCE